MPKVSIIIPIYNTAPYICKCLDSVLKQTLKDIEIICINDGCTDGTAEILNEYSIAEEEYVLRKFNKGEINGRANCFNTVTTVRTED